jgi:hypothetical protein
MNVLFHTTTAIGIVVLLTNTKNIQQSKHIATTSLIVFVTALFSHGILDYIPHCYPIPSKLDVLLGLIMILTGVLLSNKRYRLIVALAFLGCIIPDLIDLSPAIMNKQLGWHLPIFNKIFPWHLKTYSGSIYNGQCTVSNINHIVLVVLIGAVFWLRRSTMKRIFNGNKS